MSMTTLSFRCSKCDFGASSMASWGSFKYRQGDKELYVERALGWCEGCASITPIEVFPTQLDIEKSESEYDQLRIKYDADYLELSQQKSLPAKAFRLDPKPPQSLSTLKMEIDGIKHDIDQMRQLSDLLINRQSSPRCLLCGSQSVFSLPKFEAPEETDEFEENKAVYVFDHPHCGGAIKAYQSSIRFAMKMRERIYDIEGRLLENIFD